MPDERPDARVVRIRTTILIVVVITGIIVFFAAYSAASSSKQDDSDRSYLCVHDPRNDTWSCPEGVSHP